jgi:hypothetical protein
MPRLSLYKPEKGQDYKFIDRQISEMFQIGATELYLHKYAGVNTDQANATADQPHYTETAVTNIQDLLFLENRDRKYDPSIYKIRGHYNVQNIDFNLSQFGLFIDNDTIFIVVHINDWIKAIGRKPISGDVFEFPHLKDEFALNDYDVSLPRYYVVEDVGRASEGFSLTWYPHLYRLKLKKILDSQQFHDLLNKAALDANGDPMLNEDGSPKLTLGDILSTRNKEYEINDTLIAQAEADAPKSGYETKQFYTMAVDPNTGNPVLKTVDTLDITADDIGNSTSLVTGSPERSGYTGYLLGDGVPPNGAAFGHGITFPTNTQTGDYFLRTDFLPNRLFRYSGSMWVKMEDNVRMGMTNTGSRQTLKTGFINNNNITGSTEVGFDLYVADNTNLSSVLTSVNYATGMVATVLVDDVKTNATVSLDQASGKARITLVRSAEVGNRVQWKLFSGSVPEKQALSKALKPKADL